MEAKFPKISMGGDKGEGKIYNLTMRTMKHLSQLLFVALILFSFVSFSQPDTTSKPVKKEKIKSISEYELIVVGSGMRMGKWTGEADDFLKKFQKELQQKKLAIFASTMNRNHF